MTKCQLTRALAKNGVIKRNKIGCNHKQDGTRARSMQETNTKREGDMQRPGMTCLVP